MTDAPEPQPTLRVEPLDADAALRDLPRDASGRPVVGGIPLLCRLGKGGMGVVYYAVHPRLRREIAVKILPRDAADREPDLVRRFIAEARLAASLPDPHLVQVLDANEDAGTHFYLMEYVAGESAGTRMRRGRLSELDAVSVVCAATRGLATAHGKGIVHRDVKPDNILIPAGGPLKAKLADLGLAKPQDASGTHATRTGVAMGTPGYMAPEQAEDAKRASYPADVFSMGATLYALLAGRPPFEGEGLAAVLRAAALSPPPPLPEDVGAATRRIVDRCLSKDPAQRYPDARALMEALEYRVIDLENGPRREVSPAQPAFDRAMLHLEKRDDAFRRGDPGALREEERAIEELAKAIEADPANAKLRVWRGGVLMELATRGPFAAAEPVWIRCREDLEAAIRLAPGDWQPRSLLGDSIRRFIESARGAGRPADVKALLAEAHGQLDRAVTLAGGDSAGPHLNRGRIRKFQDDLLGALQDLGQAAALEPGTWVIHAERGVVRQMLKDFHGAIEDFDRALALSPDNVRILEARGNAKSDSGDPERAAIDYRRAFQLDPGRADIGGRAVSALLDHADRMMKRHLIQPREESLREAERLAGLVLRAQPDDPDSLELLARVLTARGDHRGALADRRRVVELAPDRPRAYVLRGETHMALQDWPAADADFTRAIARSPGDASIFFLRSAARYRLRTLDSARADLEEAVHLEPAEGSFRAALIQVLQELDHPETKRCGEEALAILPPGDPHRLRIEKILRNSDL